ncbi:hemagglutinin repeat-containing protein, partial [Gallibacterium salpingitidis]
AAKNTRKEDDFYAKKKSGLMSSGGLGFTIGSRSEKHDYTDHETTQSDARATIGSLGGDVTLVAGQQATILGTDLIAQPDKTIDITAKSLKVEAGKDIIESTEQHEFKQSGLTVSLSTPTTDMAMKARESLARSQQVKDSRLKALYEIKAAQEGAIAAQEAKKTVDAVQSGQKADFKVSVSIGSSKSSSSSTTTQVVHQGSTLNAGNINLTTTAGDIDVVGSTIQAANSASLTSAKDIHLSSAQDSTSQRSDNKNSGWSAGVFVGSSGGSYGFGIEGSAQIGKGYENSDTITQRNTTVTGQTVNLRSGEDTTLQGAVVTGDKVNIEVGKNLVIESRQDSNHYNSQQVQAGVSASVAIYGSGSNASANMSLNKAKLNYAQVETQSGIQAGATGLNVNVAGNTHLKGAIVESQAKAENNQFTTGSLSAESIANQSEVKVQSVSAGISTNMNQNIANGFAAGLSALGNIHKQDSSTTHSAIGSNIQLTTQQGEIPTTLSRDTATANERVQKADMEEMKARQEMAQVIGDIANNGITLVLKPKLDEAERQKAEAEAILKEDKTNAAALEQKRLANDVIKEYGQGGKIQLAVRAVTGVLQGIATGDASQAAVGGLSPYINHQIKEATTDKDGNVNLEANLMAHALLGAIEAYATGNNAAAGAAGAVSGELAAKLITEQLYQKSPEQLTEAQKQTVSALSQLASGLAGGLISDSTAGAINSAEIGKRAVENNFNLNYTNEELEGMAINAKASRLNKEIDQQVIDKFEREHPELIENLKITGDIAAFLADLTPGIGDAKSFAEAEDGVDYLLATIGMMPGSDIVTKPLKVAKEAFQKAKKAERLGNISDANQYINKATEALQKVKALDVGSYKDLKKRSVVGDNLELDHVPSISAQIKNLENLLGRKLSKEEETRLRNETTVIAIPKEIHKESRTYKGKNTQNQISSDSKDLCTAQCLDLEKNKENLLKYGFDEREIDQAIQKVKDRNLERGISE